MDKITSRPLAREVNGNSRSHGQSGHPAYYNYVHMMDRCYNPKHKQWRRYGGRGITVCDRWHNIHLFLEDMGSGWKPGLSLERKDNEAGYSPGNVIWATAKVQANNRSPCRILELDGLRLNVTQWAEKLSVSRQRLYSRLKRGWSDRRILTL